MFKLISLFSGCGGLDLGFLKAGFNIIWANEYDKSIWETYRHNHPDTFLDTRDIRTVPFNEIPDCDGIIGGPPCQAWSEGGKMLGLKDERGAVFYEYIKIVAAKKPLFFCLENVAGILDPSHKKALDGFISMFNCAGYKLSVALLNAVDYKIPQDRKRVFIIGMRDDINITYQFPPIISRQTITLQQAIGDINEIPTPYLSHNIVEININRLNHDYYCGAYDNKFMARNRVRTWTEPSFTIQALAKNAPIHPQAPKMHFVNSNKRTFEKGKEHLYRHLSIRECARIQTFPDSFRFIYSDIQSGYRMVGNAVPPRLAFYLATSVKQQLS